MNTKQKLTPKYWVVHDTTTDDVFIDTACKSIKYSIEAFLNLHAYSYFGTVDDEEVAGMFYDHPSLDCSLIEINLVKENK